MTLKGHFTAAHPDDLRPQEAIEAARAWARGELPMMDARAVGGHAMGAAGDLTGSARFAAYAAGQAACVGHVAEHDLGAAAHAIKAARTRTLEAIAAEILTAATQGEVRDSTTVMNLYLSARRVVSKEALAPPTQVDFTPDGF